MEPRIQYAKTKDGLNIAYYVIGDGEPLVFLSGGTMSHIQLEWQTPQKRDFYSVLTEGRSIVRYDGRGSGLSDENVEPLSLETCLLDLDAVVDALQIERFSLLAPAFIGPPAIAYAARNPERVSELILWCTSARNVEVVSSPGNRALGALREADWHLYTEVVAFINYGWDAGDAGRSFAKRMRETMTPEESRRSFSEMYRLDASTELENVQARTLVMQRGSAGPVGSKSVGAGRALAAAIPNAELLILEGEVEQITSGDTATTIAAINEFLGAAGETETSLPSGTAIILFLDIADSTALTTKLGDAAYREKERAMDTSLRAAITGAAGTPIEGKVLGDGVMAVFTSARDAIEAAQRCRDLGNEAGLPLHLGIHAGDVVREGNNVHGGAVQVAARYRARPRRARSWCPTSCAVWPARRRASSSKIAVSTS